MSDVKVVATENGPYKVTGVVELVDHEGNAVAVRGATIFLCRCGHSANKPFCDGSHAKVGFDGSLAASV